MLVFVEYDEPFVTKTLAKHLILYLTRPLSCITFSAVLIKFYKEKDV